MATVAWTSDLQAILRERFGLESFRPKQQEVIDYILKQEHTLALLPTGYGKSLCYQAPSQMLPGITLVVSPLIALMRDQVEGLRRRGITNATVLNSSVPLEDQDERIAGIVSGAFRLVYVAPERFESPRFRNLLYRLKISLLVIDEAHCISHWGHDFRPQYRNLSNYLTHVPGATILALTATATQPVQTDIVQCLNLPSVRQVIGSFDRPNLRFEVRQVKGSQEKDRQLLGLLSGRCSPAIVYVSSRKEAERLSSWLKEQGIRAAFYHAGLTADKRERAQRDFESERSPVIVSTVAFGMGVDKPNIRDVIHYNLPGSLENYYQEAGRAGRDGLSATCTLLFQAKDIHTQRWLFERNYPSPQQVQSVYRTIRLAGLVPIRSADISEATGVTDSALNSALDLLKHVQLIDVTAEGAYCDRSFGEAEPPINMTFMLERRRRDEHRLSRMISYAYNTDCRRAFILQYFGQSPEGSCSGCDICNPVSALPPPAGPREPVSGSKEATAKRASEPNSNGSQPLETAILRTVDELDGRVGRTVIAGILVGKKSAKLSTIDQESVACYGKFEGHSRQSVLLTIDELIRQGHLKSSGGLYPKLLLAAAGRRLLDGARLRR